MGAMSTIQAAIELTLKIWGWVSGRAKKKLQNRRIELQEENRKAQIDGDINALRRTRAQIEEIDRRLDTGDY